MLKRFDHATIVVRDPPPAVRFLEALDFYVDKDVVISGKVFSDYMGVPGIEARHITLVLRDAPARTEIQLLHYRNIDQPTGSSASLASSASSLVMSPSGSGFSGGRTARQALAR